MPRGRRAGPETARRLVQAGSLAVVVAGVFLVRGNAERWCPFGGVETVYAYATEGNTLCSVGVANLFVLAALLLSVLLFRRAFCSHACPIGTVAEWVRAGARRLGIPAARPSAALDRGLSLLKYAVLALVVWVTWRAGELLFREACPAYALLGRHGADITSWAYVVSGAIVVGSLFLSVPFCRWLCPLAAVMNPLSRLGLARIRRDPARCADCGKCARACPMGIPVAETTEVRHARCTACLACLAACPSRGRGTLAFGLPGTARRALSGPALAALVVGVLAAGVAVAAWFPLPSFRWTRGDASAASAVLEMTVGDLTCRGRANLLVYFLDRDDDLAVDGPLRVEAWPAPERGEARIAYDPTRTSADLIRAALVEPYHEADSGLFRTSPFAVEGHDPLGLAPATRRSP